MGQGIYATACGTFKGAEMSNGGMFVPLRINRKSGASFYINALTIEFVGAGPEFTAVKFDGTKVDLVAEDRIAIESCLCNYGSLKYDGQSLDSQHCARAH